MRLTANIIGAMLAMGGDVNVDTGDVVPRKRERYHRDERTPPEVVAKIRAKAEAKRKRRAARGR